MLTGLEGYIVTQTIQKPALEQRTITPGGLLLALLHHWEYFNT